MSKDSHFTGQPVYSQVLKLLDKEKIIFCPARKTKEIVRNSSSGLLRTMVYRYDFDDGHTMGLYPRHRAAPEPTAPGRSRCRPRDGSAAGGGWRGKALSAHRVSGWPRWRTANRWE